MSDTPNFGKIRVGIDWDGKGIVSFNQAQSDPLNLIPNAPFLHSSVKSFHTGTSFSDLPKLPPDAPLAQILDLNDRGFYSLNPFGAEFYFLTFLGAGVSSFVLGGDGGSVYTIPVVGSTEYTLWVWLAGVDSFTNDGTHVLSLEEIEHNGALAVTVNTSDTFDLTGSYAIQAIRLNFTTDVDSEWLTFRINRTDPDSNNMLLNILGAMLLDGNVIDEPVYNAGTVNGYLDDITSYVISMNGRIGKTSWESVMPDEGTLSLLVNNADKRFSPEYASSPYFGLLKPYKRIWVTITDENNKINLLWSGWTHQFSIQTGITNTRQATIAARQGIFNIEAQDPALLVVSQDGFSSEFVTTAMSGGYEIPTGATDIDSVPDFILQYADFGAVIPLFSPNFPNNPDRSYIDALQSLSELNGNYLWLSRHGRIIFKSYATVKLDVGDAVDYGLLLGANYIFSPRDLYKKIVVRYDAWNYNNVTPGLIEMQGQEQNIYHGATNFPFPIHPIYNGKPLIGDVILDVTSFLPVDYNASPSFGTANAAFTPLTDGIYTYYTALANNTTDIDYRLSLISRLSENVWYVVAANQETTATGTEPKALDTLTYNNPLVTNSSMADTFLALQVDRRTNITSWFDEIQIANKNAEAISFITNRSVGDVFNLREEQTGNVGKVMIIIGESFSWSPGYINVTYNLAPTGGVLAVGLLDDNDDLLTDENGDTIYDDQ